jgi:hypothetical protein
MSTEITSRDLAKLWRLNPKNNRQVDWRKNRRGARWTKHSIYTTHLAAQAALYELREGNDEDE